MYKIDGKKLILKKVLHSNPNTHKIKKYFVNKTENKNNIRKRLYSNKTIKILSVIFYFIRYKNKIKNQKKTKTKNNLAEL